MIDFLAANWLWIAAIVFFVGMHRGGHGCGMHRSDGQHDRDSDHTADDGEQTRAGLDQSDAP